MRLKAGPWPRGGRPFVFEGEWWGDEIPGALVKTGTATTTVSAPPDAAWIFDRAGLQVLRWPGPSSMLDDPSSRGLFDYQVNGRDWLAARDWALLADEMGLGKTAQAISAAEARGPRSQVLILAPALAKHHWAREVKRWAGENATVLDGLRPEPELLQRGRYVIANYDILSGQRRRDEAGKMLARNGLPGWGDVLAERKFPIVICDEAHLLRGDRSRRTKAVRGVAAGSTCVWLLTGTPMPNRVRDLWALWDLASGGLAGPFWPWARAYADARKGQYGWEADGASRTDELRQRMSFWCLGRTKVEVGLQLPPFRREVVPVDVGKAAHRETFDPTAPDRVRVVDTALRATARAKRPAVVDMAAEAVAAGQKVVVLVYLREQAEAIGHDLHEAGVACSVVTGAQSTDQRDVAAQAFREHVSACAFVATIDSVGVAISLVGADLLIFGDLSYEPAKLLQAEGRVHRIGSGKPVLCRYVTAAGTIDDAVIEAVVSKLDVQQEVFGENDAQKNLQSALGYSRPTTDAVVAALFEKLCNAQ